MTVKNCSLIFLIIIVSTTTKILAVRNDNLNGNLRAVSGASAEIINGSYATIEMHSNNYIYCRINDSSVEDFHMYKVIWKDPCGNVIREWKMNSGYSVVGIGPHQKYSYLTFNRFQKQLAGIYTCELRKHNSFVDSSSITVSPARRDGTRIELPSTFRHSCRRSPSPRRRHSR